MNEITFNIIGYVKSKFKYRYETPRQGVLSEENYSVIELKRGYNFEQALKGLEGFERIWVIYVFHLNKNWKPMIIPPRHTNRKKVGVFASRAPYRPNQIGLSCVRLEKIENLKIYISESDILDGTPILDIKPYLPYSDSFPNVNTGWVKDVSNETYEIEFSNISIEKIGWLKENANINLDNYAKVQLSIYPDDLKRKRITKFDEDLYQLAYRTWRIKYRIDYQNKKVLINDIISGYKRIELEEIEDDKYKDKNLHQKFNNVFK